MKIEFLKMRKKCNIDAPNQAIYIITNFLKDEDLFMVRRHREGRYNEQVIIIFNIFKRYEDPKC